MKLISKNTIVLVAVLGLLLFFNTPYLKQFLIVIIILVFVFSNDDKIFKGFFKNNLSILKLVTYSFSLAFGFLILMKFAIKPALENIIKVPVNYGSFDLVKNNINFLIRSYFIGWIIGAFCEEIIFRGFLLNSISSIFSKKIGIVIAILLSSVIFGYLHNYQGITGQFLTGFTGVFLSIIYLKSRKNVWLCILTHGFINTLSLTALYF